MDWKEEMVDKLIARMKNGEEIVYFRDDDVFNESTFDAHSILQDKIKTSGALLYVGKHTYLWEGDCVVLQGEEIIEKIIKVLKKKCTTDSLIDVEPLYTDKYMREIAEEIIAIVLQEEG